MQNPGIDACLQRRPNHATGETVSLFTTTFTRSLSVAARPAHLSSDAGAVLLCEIREHTGPIGLLTTRPTGPVRPDPRDAT
jgi:hypothetical protein